MQFSDVIGFDWDKVNTNKNRKHRVEDREAEEAFFDRRSVVYRDVLHSQVEKRYILIGQTSQERLIYVIFTYRDSKVRIVSARDTNRKEDKFYEKRA